MICHPSSIQTNFFLSSAFDQPIDWTKEPFSCLVQPNGIDMPIDRIWQVHNYEAKNKPFVLLKEKVAQRFSTYELVPRTVSLFFHETKKEEKLNNMFILSKGFYEFLTPFFVEIANDEVGIFQTRSSLIRAGIMVTSGLYDSGYRGPIGGVLFSEETILRYIERGAPIAQFIIRKVHNPQNHLYCGQYGFDSARHKKISEPNYYYSKKAYEL